MRPAPTVEKPPTTVAIALGSNLGDRRAALAFAERRLRSLLHQLLVSRIVETAPHGEGLQDQPPYLNAAATGRTRLGPREVLDALLGIEADYGRERPYRNAPRTLDLDLVLFGDAILTEPGLRLPHARFRERLFVLEPLAEIGPDLLDPVTGRTVGELLDDLRRQGGTDRAR